MIWRWGSSIKRHVVHIMVLNFLHIFHNSLLFMYHTWLVCGEICDEEILEITCIQDALHSIWVCTTTLDCTKYTGAWAASFWSNFLQHLKTKTKCTHSRKWTNYRTSGGVAVMDEWCAVNVEAFLANCCYTPVISLITLNVSNYSYLYPLS